MWITQISLGLQPFFFHTILCTSRNFSTGCVDKGWGQKLSTEKFSTFHNGCGENFGRKKSILNRQI